ncbi:MAG: putative Ig domain-containing protein, partial [Candidatus Woesearchaeota archaeon]
VYNNTFLGTESYYPDTRALNIDSNNNSIHNNTFKTTTWVIKIVNLHSKNNTIVSNYFYVQRNDRYTPPGWISDPQPSNNIYCLNNKTNTYLGNGEYGKYSCPPTIHSTPSTLATEGTLYTYRVNATDPEGDTLYYTDNTSLFNINPSTGLVSFTPTQSQAGNHSITLTVSDGYLGTAAQSFNLNISAINNPPNLTYIGQISGQAGTNTTYQATATDEEDDTLYFDLNFTNFLSINSLTGLISLYPNTTSNGTYYINISVNDTVSTDSEVIKLVILPPNITNSRPNITSYYPLTANNTILEDGNITFNISYYDADGNSTVSVKWYKDGSLQSGETSYTFIGNFTTAGSNAGIYNITALITDGQYSDSQYWKLRVNRTPDSDGDGIPNYRDNCPYLYNTTNNASLCTNDTDNDGIDDDEDRLYGNLTAIDTNINIIGMSIDNSTNITQVVNGTKRIQVTSTTPYENGSVARFNVIEFDYNFSLAPLSLSGLIVKKQTSESIGSVLVKGLNRSAFSGTKTVYVEDLHAKRNICVKDAEVAFLTEITTRCNDENETIVPCTGRLFQNKYTCTDLGDWLKVEGLSYSGVEQYTCEESWSCGGWGECSSGVQTRSCTDANNCGTTDDMPSESQSCSSSTVTAGSEGGRRPDCIPDWNCSEWGECSPESVKTRICNDRNNCGNLSGKPEEEDVCVEKVTVSEEEKLEESGKETKEISEGAEGKSILQQKSAKILITMAVGITLVTALAYLLLRKRNKPLKRKRKRIILQAPSQRKK